MSPLQSVLLAASLFVGDCYKVIVGDPFTFPETCKPSESWTLLRILAHGDTREVAACQSGAWTVSGKYRGRTQVLSSRIVFTHAQYNDAGAYEHKSSSNIVQLDVVAATEKSVTEGDAATLPCYCKTTDDPVWTLRWEKNGNPLLELKCSSDGCRGNPPDRLSVSTDWYTSGNMSLTVERVQPGDSGDYICNVQGQSGNRSGDPAAVRLTVMEERSPGISSSATPANVSSSGKRETQICSEHTWKIIALVFIGILVFLIVFIVLFLLCDKFRSAFGKLSNLGQRCYHVAQHNHLNL